VTRRLRGRILVTRSQPGAGRLVEALTSAGFDAIAIPMLTVESIAEPGNRSVLTELGDFALVIFVSVHAVQFGVPLIDARWPEHPRGPTWIAVGAATAAALEQRGINALVPKLESSDGILALAQTARVAGQRVLIVAGEGGREDLQTELARRGARVDRLEVYRRVRRGEDAALAGLRGRLAAVVISSADGGRTFAACWDAVSGDRDVALVVPSARVAEVMRDLGFGVVVTSVGAGAEAVIEALEHMGEDER
jgi:uroporphyrinogen-III synthase